MNIHAATLFDLLTRSAGTLRTVYFRNLQLKSGTWETLLTAMCNFPRLTNFTLHIGYDPKGESKKYNSCLLQHRWGELEKDEEEEINTCHFRDRRALNDFVEAVITNRVREGLEPYSALDSYSYA